MLLACSEFHVPSRAPRVQYNDSAPCLYYSVISQRISQDIQVWHPALNHETFLFAAPPSCRRRLQQLWMPVLSQTQGGSWPSQSREPRRRLQRSRDPSGSAAPAFAQFSGKHPPHGQSAFVECCTKSADLSPLKFFCLVRPKKGTVTQLRATLDRLGGMISTSNCISQVRFP